MNIEKRIHQGITVIGVCLAILMMIIGMVGLYYAAVYGELIIAFASLMSMLIAASALYSVPREFNYEPQPELTPESLSLSPNTHIYRFRNQYLKSSLLGNHVVSYAVIDFDANYIHFLNCAYRSEIKCPELFPLFRHRLRGSGNAKTSLLDHYTNIAGCDISSLVDIAKTRGGDDYLIYWPGHVANVARRTLNFPQFEEALRNCGFDIKNRCYVPPEEAREVRALGSCVGQIVFFASVFLGSCVAPMHGPWMIAFLFVFVICMASVGATIYLFNRWEKHVLRKRVIWREQDRMAKLKMVEATPPTNEA